MYRNITVADDSYMNDLSIKAEIIGTKLSIARKAYSYKHSESNKQRMDKLSNEFKHIVGQMSKLDDESMFYDRQY